MYKAEQRWHYTRACRSCRDWPLRPLESCKYSIRCNLRRVLLWNTHGPGHPTCGVCSSLWRLTPTFFGVEGRWPKLRFALPLKCAHHPLHDLCGERHARNQADEMKLIDDDGFAALHKHTAVTQRLHEQRRQPHSFALPQSIRAVMSRLFEEDRGQLAVQGRLECEVDLERQPAAVGGRSRLKLPPAPR